MNEDVHARFLDYLETFNYFVRPGVVRLTREEFEALDRAYHALKAKPELTPEEAGKLRELKALLMLD